VHDIVKYIALHPDSPEFSILGGSVYVPTKINMEFITRNLTIFINDVENIILKIMKVDKYGSELIFLPS
jgi:hypothetical protein